MKNFKIISIVIALALCLSLMVGCNNNNNEPSTEAKTEAQTEATTSENTTVADTSVPVIEDIIATESTDTTSAEESSANNEDTSANETEAPSTSSNETVSEETTSSASTTAKEETTNADTTNKVEESSNEETSANVEESSDEETSAKVEESSEVTSADAEESSEETFAESEESDEVTSADAEESGEETSADAEESDEVTSADAEESNEETSADAEESSNESNDTTEAESKTETETETETEPETEPEVTTESDVTMVFNGSSCEISNKDAVKVSGKNYTVVKAGTYIISGTMNDGQIRVDVADTEKVTLVLNNFTGSNSTSAVIYVINADEVYIDMEKNSVNTLTDATIYDANEKPNACIYAADDLTIKGGGTLNVIGNFNNGIGCKNDIDIKNGVVNVTAVKNAIKGNDSVTVRGDAEVNILDAKDGIKSDTTDKANKGFIHIIEEAKVTVVCCSDDALQATQNITITAGATLTIQNAKTDVNCDGTINIADGCIIK